jgi:predicted secreted hydrolase
MNTSFIKKYMGAGLLLLVACDYSFEKTPVTTDASSIVSLHTELGGDAGGYERACGPREFTFPADHGAHREFRNEWWYITGNVKSESTDLGFHVTFFRVANQPEPADSESAWAASQFYMGHFAVTAAGQQKVRAHERFARAAAGLAGAEQRNSETTVWLDDWKLTHTASGAWALDVADGSEKISLTLTAEKPVVLQGEAGYSRKSADPCNASYYYSMPRLRAEGQISVAGKSYDVTGSAWLDREWSSSALAADQVGWDWFALQLDDGRDIMFYQLRNSDGSADPHSHAVEIDQSGDRRSIPVPELIIDHWWQSPNGGNYPVAGRLRRSDTGEVIVFEPLIENQELLLTVRYWEGAIRLRNESGEPVGRGYLELTGY